MKTKILLGLGIFIFSILSVKAIDKTGSENFVLSSLTKTTQGESNDILKNRVGLFSDQKNLNAKAFKAATTEKKKQSMDSIVGVNDFGSTFSKETFKYDSRGNAIEHVIYADFGDGKLTSSSYKSYRYNDQNYLIEEIKKELKDPSIDKWLEASRSTYKVDENGTIDMQWDYFYDSDNDSWINGSEITYTRDSEGYILDQTIKAWNRNTEEFYNYYKAEIEYDDKKSKKSVAEYEWKDGKWIGNTALKYAKQVFEYRYIDSNIYTTVRDYYRWDMATDSWVVDFEERYNYNSNGLPLLTTNKVFQNGEWVQTSYGEYTYLDDFYPLTAYVDAVNPEGVRNYLREGYELIKDENGTKVFTGYREQTLNGVWTKTFDYEFHYEGKNLILLCEYNFVNGVVDRAQKIGYEFDEDGNSVVQIDYRYVSSTNTWIEVLRSERVFENNILVGSRSSSWNNTTKEWIPLTKTDYEYNEDGFRFSETTWSYHQGTWIGQSGIQINIDYNVPFSEIVSLKTEKLNYKLLGMERLAWDENDWYSSEVYTAYYSDFKPTSIGQIDNVDKNHSVYANNNTLYVNTANAETVNVYTVSGILALTTQKTAGTATINISNLAKGIYIVNGSTGWNSKIIK